MIGLDPSVGAIRFTMGSDNLMGGIEFIAIAMGAFGLTEIFSNLEGDLKLKNEVAKIQGLFPTRDEWPIVMKSIGRGSILGFIIGLIPGTNSVIPSVLSYSMEKRLSKHPEKFGTGAIEGVAGPETSNNSYCGGAMVPLFTLGIPTSSTMAMIMGAFIIHGLTPGPTLFTDHPDVVWAVIASMFIGNVILIILNLPLANVWAQVTRVPNNILFPIIIVIAVLGVYGMNNSMFDVSCMIFFGILCYFLKKADYPMVPLMITFMLGDKVEYSLVQSMTIFRGDATLFLKRPICVVLLIIDLIVIIFSIISSKKRIEKFGAEETEI
jgi:putative tricarboxylic transport membrane protein